MARNYITSAGDMWDMIAYKELGGEQYTNDLVAANIQHKDITVFGSGTVLTIPDISNPKPSTLPPWLR